LVCINALLLLHSTQYVFPHNAFLIDVEHSFLTTKWIRIN